MSGDTFVVGTGGVEAVVGIGLELGEGGTSVEDSEDTERVEVETCAVGVGVVEASSGMEVIGTVEALSRMEVVRDGTEEAGSVETLWGIELIVAETRMPGLKDVEDLWRVGIAGGRTGEDSA